MFRCRFCQSQLAETFADLGMSPLSNSYIPFSRLNGMERFYPLHAYVCCTCFLVQLAEFETPDKIFSDYAYFSSYADSWLKHCEAYAQEMMHRWKLGASSLVVEVASNDGYLLQYFKQRGVPVLGIEPAANVAKVAMDKGIPTEVAFFGEAKGSQLAAAGKSADLIAANNVLAHVPDINDFVKGFKRALKPSGRITVEFPHLLQLMEHNQFDTIYHEHFSYLSLGFVAELFAAHGLRVFDVDEIPTHGGSLRVHGCHAGDETKPSGAAVASLLDREAKLGLRDPATYRQFAEKVVRTKCEVLDFFIGARRAGKRVAGYGAPAKGNTLLNYCGLGPEFIQFTVDRSPHKQGLYLPGTHIPIHAPEVIFESKPDYLFILPWNLRDEIVEQMAGIRSWGGKFVVPIPKLEIF
ncbi:MAG: class I SAM-dependent methyltransferase [Betaproteobacteria bacterium]|nr:class I SAM-dependent methyltransferase [Betaproteobacteria bacterium]